MQELQQRTIEEFDGVHFDIPEPVKRIETLIAPPGGALAGGPQGAVRRGGVAGVDRRSDAVPRGADGDRADQGVPEPRRGGRGLSRGQSCLYERQTKVFRHLLSKFRSLQYHFGCPQMF